MYYLQYASLKVLKISPDGREQVLRFLDAGEIFNGIALEESGGLVIAAADASLVSMNLFCALQAG